MKFLTEENNKTLEITDFCDGYRREWHTLTITEEYLNYLNNCLFKEINTKLTAEDIYLIFKYNNSEINIEEIRPELMEYISYIYESVQSNLVGGSDMPNDSAWNAIKENCYNYDYDYDIDTEEETLQWI